MSGLNPSSKANGIAAASISKLMGSAEAGEDRDLEKPGQTRLCLLIGEKSQLPVCQTPYTGCLNDVSAFLPMLDEAYAPHPQPVLKIVTDSGSFSAKGFKGLRSEGQCTSSEPGSDPKWKCGFLTAVPLSNGFAQMLADKEQAHIDGPENVIGLPEGVVYGVHRFGEWPGTGARLNVFIYSNLKNPK